MIPKAVINCTLYFNNIYKIYIYNNNNNYKKNIFKFILKSLLTKNTKYRVQMKKLTENNLQQSIVLWYNNIYCLKHNNPRGMIFSIPNGGTRNIREAMTFKATGLLKGVSDLIVIFPNNKLCFIELKLQKGIQSDEQKDFECRVSSLGFEYHLIRSLEDFITLTHFNLH